MKDDNWPPGTLIRMNRLACRVYGFRSNVGLIVDTIRGTAGYPPDYEIIIDGRKTLVGYAIKDSAEVINE
jgi:hypothetical protein